MIRTEKRMIIFTKNAQITATLHTDIFVMTIHVLPTNFAISREVHLDDGRCHGFIGFSLQLCSERHSV